MPSPALRILAKPRRLRRTEHPDRLRQLDHPPVDLFAWGTLPTPETVFVAVVGSRRASPLGTRQAFRLGHGLAAAGIGVVSGLARGIDAAVLEGAVAGGGRAGAVLGNGLPEIYPAQNRGLAARLRETGGFILSEFPPGTPPLPYHFPRRNRLISGLAVGVVVVQATLASGSLVTAGWALDQGREVWAYPGPSEGPAYAGCHRLIQEGASLVTGPQDLLDHLALIRPGTTPGSRGGAL